MINFLTPDFHLNKNKSFDQDTYNELIHVDTVNNAAVMFSYWDGDQYVETKKGNKRKSIVTRELYSHRGAIDLESSHNLLYNYSNAEIMLTTDTHSEKHLHTIKEVGLTLIGNFVTLYHAQELADNVFNKMPMSKDGYTVDLRVGHKFHKNEVSGLVSEISYYNESYVITINDGVFGVYEQDQVLV